MMARIQNSLALVVAPTTAARMYAKRRVPTARKPRDLAMTVEMIDCLPDLLRLTVLQMVERGGVRAYLVAEGDNLTVEIRNKKVRVK
jgi:ABC-type uncharacterized transport system auxiliary subunit